MCSHLCNPSRITRPRRMKASAERRGDPLLQVSLQQSSEVFLAFIWFWQIPASEPTP